MGRKGNKRRALHGMELDAAEPDSGGWVSGGADLASVPQPDGNTAEMDTSEFGVTAPGIMAAQPPRQKAPPAKRGARTRNQKMRKAARLDKALALADRAVSKVTKRSSLQLQRKTGKKLWVTEKGVEQQHSIGHHHVET